MMMMMEIRKVEFDRLSKRIVTWRLKAEIVEPEQTSVAEQRLGNHVSAAMNIIKD
jgi:hypothetical protein